MSLGSAERRWPALALVATLTVVGAGLGAGALPALAGAARIRAVGAESQYANVIAQVGGPEVRVRAIVTNPNTDPHSFEASPSVAELVGQAQLVVQNGLDYDAFMDKIETAAPSTGRQVIDVQRLLGLSSRTRNPHLWYKPTAMPKVARAVASALGRIEPRNRALFQSRASAFVRSLDPWLKALASLRKTYPHLPVAVTEPVADYMLQAAGARILTPWSLQADIMNGVDPAPQAVSFQESLFQRHRVKVFLYNRQVTDPLTQSLLSLAERDHVPVVAVYETMPTPGFDYQSWMLAEVRALTRARAQGRSTKRL